jgi:hypothetical protein
MCHEWRYYMKEGRVNLVANYNTSTVTYDHEDTVDRELTLDVSGGAAWPSWAKFGRIAFSDVVYPVESRTSNSIVVLGADFNPGDDVTTATAYNLYRSVYPLPEDLWRLYDVAVEKSYWLPYYITPSEWLQRERFQGTTGQTWAWTIMADPDDQGRFAIWVDPAPDTAEPLGFIYRRRPRALRWAGTETAARTYTFAALSAGDTSLVTSVALPSNMVGSIIRLADSTSTLPTGLAGTSPFLEQHKITGLSGTTVSIAGTISQAYAEATNKLVVSDPIDMNDTMIEALKAQIEYRFARFANDQRGTVTARDAADFELRRALEAESRFQFSPSSPSSRYQYLFTRLGNTITTSSG